ncbi:hypothetical protein NHX12_012632 [Muraenolepis orangiensis]|uniref:HAT C-terminal dimerisation domain-containing protein n=1 Tax=Muraenolepis orangiensis TaxID=630683 RepID=A0A9Q0DGI7_9TELE|nr:hypothetical protein NHX12_012632 [Muraenolepis orangiensis]
MASVSKVSILDYFNIVFEGENGKIESNCKACGTRIQAKRSVTSNFVTHLKRKHQAIHDPRQVLISEAIAKMIVRDLQPAYTVENQGFRELLQLLEPRYAPEPRQYFHNQLLPAYAYQAQLATRQALASALALSLSLDLWSSLSSGTSGYLGVTCHFLTCEWQMRSALLACLPLGRRGSGGVRHVLAEFEEVCHAHGVSGKAFRVVAEPFPADAGPLARTADNEEEAGSRNGHCERREDGEWEDPWEQGLGASRVDCFSDSLDRCVREGLRSCPQLCSTLAKAACFYNYITSAVPPEKLRQVLDGPGGMTGKPGSVLLPDVKDWAAQLKVLRQLLDSVEFLEELSGRGELALSDPERAQLRELIDTLEPFTEAWDMIHWDRQADRHVSISLALPCVLGLRKHLSETSTPHCPSLLAGLAQAVGRRLAPILEDPLYITVTTLDPQFKLTWSSNPEWHRQVLLEELSKHSPPSLPNTTSAAAATTTELHSQAPRSSPATSPVSSLSRPCKLFSFIKQRPATQAKSLEQELAGYLREEPTDEEPLHYWRRKAIDFPLLAQVAKRAFTIPASSTVVSGIFTTARQNLQLERGCVLPKHLETLIYLKANYRLLWT